MAYKARQINRKLSDNLKAGVFRWWIAGMSYFLIGFGTQMGMFQDPVDLIFFLGVGVGLAMALIYNPIAYGMFRIERRGRIDNKSYYERRGWQNAIYKLVEIFKNMLIVWLVYMTYQNINLLINQIWHLPEGTILIPGEPFGFATLYMLYHQLLRGLGNTVEAAMENVG